MKKKEVQGRIRYVEDWNGNGEHFVFEVKRADEPETEWGLQSAYPLKDDMIHYTALTTIRHWIDCDVDFWFGA